MTRDPGSSFPRSCAAGWTRLLDSAFPARCLVSGEWLPPGSRFRFLSPAALQGLFFIRGAACQTCGYPFPGWVEGPRTCPHCRDLDPVFEAGKSLFLLRDTARNLLFELKYRSNRAVLHDLLELVTESPDYLEFLRGAVLVPVPLHWRREWQRGFNQSRLLAEGFAPLSGAIGVWDGLCRIRNGPSQTSLSRTERQRNAARAFSMRGSLPFSHARYVLVDDVFTTGATLNACARVLRAAGARWVDVVSFAHG